MGNGLAVKSKNTCGTQGTGKGSKVQQCKNDTINKNDSVITLAGPGKLAKDSSNGSKVSKNLGSQVANFRPNEVKEAKAEEVAPGGDYKIQKGDNLYTLAKIWGCTVKDILNANPKINPKTKKINEGKILKRPNTNAAKAVDVGGEYKIQKGDNLYKLAKIWGCTVQDILDANPNINRKTKKINEGKILKRPNIDNVETLKTSFVKVERETADNGKINPKESTIENNDKSFEYFSSKHGEMQEKASIETNKDREYLANKLEEYKAMNEKLTVKKRAQAIAKGTGDAVKDAGNTIKEFFSTETISSAVYGTKNYFHNTSLLGISKDTLSILPKFFVKTGEKLGNAAAGINIALNSNDYDKVRKGTETALTDGFTGTVDTATLIVGGLAATKAAKEGINVLRGMSAAKNGPAAAGAGAEAGAAAGAGAGAAGSAKIEELLINGVKTTKDARTLLGVSEKATKNQIMSAFRKLARRYHPDILHTKEATIMFQNLNAAKDLLI